jgi:hypothetical protein
MKSAIERARAHHCPTWQMLLTNLKCTILPYFVGSATSLPNLANIWEAGHIQTVSSNFLYVFKKVGQVGKVGQKVTNTLCFTVFRHLANLPSFLSNLFRVGQLELAE